MFTVFVILGCNFSANADPLSTPAKDDSGIVWALHDSEDDVWKCITCQTKKGVLYKIELSPNMKDWTSMAEVYGLGQRFSWNLFALNPVPNAIPAELSPVPVSLVAQNIITEGANGGVWLHWKSLDTGEMIHHIASDLSIVPQWGKGDTSTNIEGAYLFSVMNSGTVEAANAFSSDLGTKDSAMMTELRSKWSSLNQATPQNIASSVSANIPPVNSTQMFYRIVSDETLDSDGDGIPDVDEFNESGNGSSGNGGGGVNPFFPQEPTVKLVGRSVSKTENDEDFEDFNSAPTSVPNSYFPANDTEGWSSSFLYPYRSRTHVWAVEMDDSALLNSERVDFIDSAATIKTQMRITINSAYIRDIVREYEYVISESVNQENDSADTHTTYPQKAVVSFIIPAGELTSSIKELVIPDEGIENIPAPVYAPERYQGELQASGGVIESSLYADMLVSKYREILRLELVPDWNRDGKINRADRNKVTAQNPWHWWINDDDDFEVVERGENANDIPGQPATLRDCNDLVVDGMRDFIDFFPLHLDIKKALASLPTAQYRYVLKHEESALKFFEYPGCDISGNSELTGPDHFLKIIASHVCIERQL